MQPIVEFFDSLPAAKQDIFFSLLNELTASVREMELRDRLKEVKREIGSTFNRLEPLKGFQENIEEVLSDIQNDPTPSEELVLFAQLLRSLRDLLSQRIREQKPEALLKEKVRIKQELDALQASKAVSERLLKSLSQDPKPELCHGG